MSNPTNPNDFRAHYLDAAEAAQTDNPALAFHLKAMALVAPTAEPSEAETALKAKIAELEAKGDRMSLSQAAIWKGDLLVAVRKRNGL